MGGNERAREGEREREKESVEKCCFSMQNDLKRTIEMQEGMYCLSKSLVYCIYRDYQKS